VVPASQSIVVQPGVIADFDADLQTACAGEPITFCANGMVPNTIYGWNFGAGGWQNVSFPNDCITYTYQDTGYFDVTLSVYNTACNALIVLEDFIYIPPAVANFTFVQDCANANEFIFESTSLGADSLTWDFGDGSPLLYNDPNPSHVFPGPGTYQVTLIAYNYDTGCEHERVRTVINEENPIVLNVLNPAGCGPHTTGFSSPNSQQFVLWEIDFGNGTTATSTLTANNTWQVVVNSPTGTNSYTNSFSVNWWPQVTFNQAGLYTINVTATDPGGCIYNYTYPDVVNVYNDPIFAQYDAVIIDDCDQVIVNFVPTGNFLENGTWTLGDGTVVDALEFTHEFTPPWDYPFSATFSVSDSFGCASSFADTLDLVAPPVPNFTVESDPSCIAETIQVNNASTGAIAGYLWDFGDPGSADNLSTDANPSHAYLNNGSYTVCLTAENTSGCQQTSCVDNAVNIISPVAEITFTPQIANCLFGVQFENSTEGEYLCSDWSFGDGQFGGGPNPYHTYSIGVYDVQLVVCNEFGCYDTTTVFDIFNLSNVIGPFNSVLDDVDCAPFQVEFNAYNTNDAQFTYFWDFGDGSGDPDNNTITNHSYLNPGTYCPSLVMQDPNGCTFLQTCEEPIVVTEFTYELGLATPVCFGETTQFQAEGATGYTFSAPELVTDLGGGFFEVNAPESTEILVTGTFADCQYTLPLEVTIHPLPSVVIELDEGVCFNEEPFALNGGLPAGSTGTYTVNGNETTVFNPSQPADATYEVVYTFTDANGCVNSDTSSIVIWPLPAVSLDPFTPACELDPVLALTGGWPENGVYTLDATEIEELNPSELGYGSYMLEYTFTDANGCAESASELVTIYPSPEPAISPPTLCWEPELIIESSTTIAQGVVSGYTWNLGENGDDSSLPTATLLTDGPGDVTVQLTVVSDQGCEASTSAIIPIHPTPVADFTADDICTNEALVVEDLSTIDGGAIADWEWTMNGVLFSNNQQPEDILVEDWGSLLVSLTVTSPQGCASTTSETIMVSPLPVLNLTADAICSGEQATVFSNASLPDGSVPDLEWNNGLGETVPNTLNLTGTYDQPGEYVIALTASSGPGCVTNETINLVVHPTPSVAFIWDENRFCAEGNTLLTDLSDVATGSLVAWYWTANGTPFSQQSEAVFTTAVPGNYTIALTVTTDEGCEAQSVENNAITVWPNPVADFYFPPELPISAAPYVHVTDRSQGANQWLYTFSDGSVYHEPDFTHTFTEPGLYELTQLVTNGFGCTDSMNVSIDFNPSLNVFVPNAFTPDDDGINEVFKPILSGAEVNHYRLVIINRWGEVVFESNDLGEGWIGNFRGGAHYVPAGVYVWQLEVGTREQFVREKFTGHVTVLR
jgi:gliding motility-associated-like protein